MTLRAAHRLVVLASQLSESLITAAICAQEIRAEVQADVDGDNHPLSSEVWRSSSARSQRPLLDQSSLCVRWNGRSLHLGHTRSFYLLERLARCPNQYVTHLDLLRDVWDDEDASVATIRSVVRHLRRKLTAGGMGALAAAIRGHYGRYVLEL